MSQVINTDNVKTEEQFVDALTQVLTGKAVVAQKSESKPKAPARKKPTAKVVESQTPDQIITEENNKNREREIAAKAARKESVAAPKSVVLKVTAKPAGLIQEGEGTETKFYKIRANGTRRAVPLLTGTTLDQARVIAKSRQDGLTVRAIADSLHLSTSSVRRLLVSLALTEEQLASQSKLAPARKAKASKAS